MIVLLDPNVLTQNVGDSRLTSIACLGEDQGDNRESITLGTFFFLGVVDFVLQERFIFEIWCQEENDGTSILEPFTDTTVRVRPSRHVLLIQPGTETCCPESAIITPYNGFVCSLVTEKNPILHRPCVLQSSAILAQLRKARQAILAAPIKPSLGALPAILYPLFYPPMEFFWA